MKLQTANTIREQLNALDRMALFAYGAHQFIGSEATKEHNGFLMFSAKNTNLYKRSVKVKITLEYNDTYTITVLRVTGRTVKDLFKQEGVYCDELIQVLDKALEGK